MNWIRFLLWSLNSRWTLCTLVIFVIGIWTLAFYASRMLREDMQGLLGEQQFSTASILATGVDQEMGERLRLLEKLAEEIPPAMLGNAPAMQAFLEQRLIFQSLFNLGITAAGLDGTVIAEVPRSASRVGVNYADRDYMIVALKEGRTAIGRPVIGRTQGAPVIVIAAPVRDGNGKVIGTVAGVINLAQANFLNKITESSYGTSGGYLLIAPQHRLIVTASDKSRVMEALPGPGINPQLDRFIIQGYEGSTVFVNPFGVEVLTAAKGVPAAGWIVAVTLPTAEAFAPIHDMQRRMLLATLLLTLLAGGLTWWMIRRQLAPMLVAAKTLAALSDANHHLQPLPITRQDEIGDLIGGFNRLLEILGQREEALRDSETRWKFAIEGSCDGLWDWNVANRTAFFSRTWKQMLGHAEDEIGNRPEEWEKRLHPEDRAATLAAVQDCLDGKTPIYVKEHRVRCKDGSYKWVLDRGILVSRGEDGKPLRMIGTYTDITERKQMEDQVHQMAFSDSLTNLPNRHLLHDRLTQAMAASKRSGCHGALMFLDLDNFKPLNDAHGHDVGDLLLIVAAERLKKCVRQTDTVARFGGDEFVVMLSELDADRAESAAQAGIVAEKIRITLAEPYLLTIRHEGKADTTVEHRCTASIGVVLFIDHEATQDELLRCADMAMYQAKDTGRNSIRFFESKS